MRARRLAVSARAPARPKLAMAHLSNIVKSGKNCTLPVLCVLTICIKTGLRRARARGELPRTSVKHVPHMLTMNRPMVDTVARPAKMPCELMSKIVCDTRVPAGQRAQITSKHSLVET